MDPDNSQEERAQKLYTHLKGFGDRYRVPFYDIFAGGGLLRSYVDLSGELSDISGLSRFTVEVILAFALLQDVSYEKIEPQIMKIL